MTTVTSHQPHGRAGVDRPQVPAMAAKPLKLRLLAVAGAAAAVFVALKLTGALDHLSFAALARNREWLVVRVEALGLGAPVLFVLAYAACTALSLPTEIGRAS